MVWDCLKLLTSDDLSIRKSNYLRHDALRGIEHHGCYWLRGITPKYWTNKQKQKETCKRPCCCSSEQNAYCKWPIGYNRKGLLPEFDPGRVTYLDGSGGI